jgi:hypothetical protein
MRLNVAGERVFRRTQRCAIADVSHGWSPTQISCGQVTVGVGSAGSGRPFERPVFKRQLDDPWYNTKIVNGKLTRTHFSRCEWAVTHPPRKKSDSEPVEPHGRSASRPAETFHSCSCARTARICNPAETNGSRVDGRDHGSSGAVECCPRCRSRGHAGDGPSVDRGPRRRQRQAMTDGL